MTIDSGTRIIITPIRDFEELQEPDLEAWWQNDGTGLFTVEISISGPCHTTIVVLSPETALQLADALNKLAHRAIDAMDP